MERMSLPLRGATSRLEGIALRFRGPSCQSFQAS